MHRIAVMTTAIDSETSIIFSLDFFFFNVQNFRIRLSSKKNKDYVSSFQIVNVH